MTACLWCPRPLPPSRRGSARKFCSPGYRAAFHKQARRWTIMAIEHGLLDINDLKRISRGTTL